MNKELDQLLRIYGEPGASSRSTSDNPALRDERESLESMKRMLDNRPRVAAPESLVRTVLEFEREDRKPRARPDRKPVARGARHSRPLFLGAGTTVMVLLAAVLLIFNNPADEHLEPADHTATSDVRVEHVTPVEIPRQNENVLADSVPGSTERQMDTVEDRPVERRGLVAVAAARPAPVQRIPQVITVSSETSREPVEAGLAWDDGGDLRRLHMMIDVMQERGDEIAWEEPAVPLELLPSRRAGANSGYQQASQQVPQW